MTTEKEEVILEIKIDQQGAEKDLEKIEGVLLNNRKALQDLNKAYNAGSITQKEYIQENIRLQANTKKEQELKRTLIKTIETESNSRNALKLKVSQLTREYDNLNRSTKEGAKRADELEKELTQLNAAITKTSKSAGLFKDQIGNYQQQFQSAAQNIRVAGVSVGDLTTKLASFANPATAALGVVAALGSAYARSTLGAKDLEFAQNQLSAATTIITNRFANLVTSSEDGEGALTKLLNVALKLASISNAGNILKLLGINLSEIAEESKAVALLAEKLEDLGRLEDEIRTNASQRLEQNQELLENIADDQISINEKVAAANIIEQNLLINKKNVLDVLEQELQLVEASAEADKDNESLLDAVILKRRQIAQESAALEKQITKINKVQDDLNRKLDLELQLQQFINREKNAPTVDLLGMTDAVVAGGGLADPIIDSSKARQDQFIAELQTVEFTEKQKQEFYRQSLTQKQQLDQLQIQSAQLVFNALSGLAAEGSAEQKALALIGIGVDTARALTSGIASSQDIPYPGNLFAMATTIATVLGNIAAAKQYIQGFAGGGYTGPGYGSPDSSGYKPAGIVHEHEYVTPKRVVLSAAAQPHIAALEGLRLRGYANGGLVTNAAVAEANQSLITANALRDLPAPEISVVEVTKIQKRVAVKERVSRLKK
jgi:hypothetical protein